jgi:hypothetical protein
MNGTAIGLTELVNELLVVLQKDLEHIEHSTETLEKLRELVVMRDDKNLNKLLDDIRSNSEEYTANEKRRGQLREEIAFELGWPAEEVRLGKLQNVVSAEQSQRVTQMRRQLAQTVSRLQSEHAGTTMLLADLTRFNRMLLNTFLESPNGREVTYDARGTRSTGDRNAFVNMQF